MDWGSILVFVSLILNLIAIIFYWIGHIVYISFAGRFYGAFDFMYLLLHSISESLVTGLLIFVAYGWTITFLKTVDFDLYIPLGKFLNNIVGMIGLVNIILTLLTKINDGDHNKYHMHDTIPSYLLLAFRFMTLMVFSIGIFLTWRKNSTQEHIKSFITKIGIVGNLYFLSLPIMVLGCTMIHIS